MGRQIRLKENGSWATVVGVAPALGVVSGNGVVGGATRGTSRWHSQTGATLRSRPGRRATQPHWCRLFRETVALLDPDIPLYQEGRLDVALAQASVGEAFGGLFTFFGLSALLLAVVGLVGVLAFSVKSTASRVRH